MPGNHESDGGATLFLERGGERTIAIESLAEPFRPASQFRTTRGMEAARIRRLEVHASTAATEVVRGVYEGHSTDVRTLSSILRQVPEVLADVLSTEGIPDTRFETAYPREVAMAVARAVATGVHVRTHEAYDSGLDGPAIPSTSVLAARVDDEERRYDEYLGRSRLAARQGDVAEMLELLAAVVERAHVSLPVVCSRTARASIAADHRGTELGVRVSVLCRRYAMLAAALVVLDWRLRRPRTHRTTGDIAASRTRRARRYLRLTVARRALVGTPSGTRMDLLGRVTDVRWIDRPEKPYSAATLVGTPGELRVPYKSIGRVGVVDGAGVWARGKVERDGDVAYLKVEFEGPGTHQRTYWEDWLANEVRASYDLYPGTVFMEWELPRIGTNGSGSDLYARIE